jgi:hypothetical protein
MFNNTPIQKRWKLILYGIAFAFLISLLYAKQAYDIHTKTQDLKSKTALIQDADLEIVTRQVKLKELSTRIRTLQETRKELPTHIALMQYIEAQCDTHQVQMIQLPKETLQTIEGYTIAQVDFSVSGTFHHILNLLYQIEAQDRIGSIAKADLELKTLRMADDRQKLLVATIRLNRLLQS